MHNRRQYVVFNLGEHHFALPLSAVERIVHAVEVTPLPKAPEIVLGVVNVQGTVIPVFDIRKRFRLPGREIELSDQFIIARTAKRTVCLVVDAAVGVQEYSEQEMIGAEEVLPAAEYLDGIAKLEDGLLLVHDLDTFLSLEEDEALDEAMS